MLAKAVWFHALEQGEAAHSFFHVGQFATLTGLERWAETERKNRAFMVCPSHLQDLAGVWVNHGERIWWSGFCWTIVPTEGGEVVINV